MWHCGIKGFEVEKTTAVSHQKGLYLPNVDGCRVDVFGEWTADWKKKVDFRGQQADHWGKKLKDD